MNNATYHCLSFVRCILYGHIDVVNNVNKVWL